MLFLAATSLLIPTASHLLLQTTEPHLIRQSRGASFVLIAVYGALLMFQFGSHESFYTHPNSKVALRKQDHLKVELKKAEDEWLSKNRSIDHPDHIREEKEEDSEDESRKKPQLAQTVMLVYLVIMVTLTAFCTQFAVDSIDKLSQKANISKPFIGLILLPILNNDATPIHHALRVEMHRTIYFTVGKCLQTALFLTPLMVLIAWGMHLNLTLSFDGFEVVSLFASVLLLNYLIIDGKSSW